MINNLRAIFAAARQHWKNTTSNFWSLSFLIGALPQIAVFAWVSVQTPDRSILSYLIVGGPLMAIWQSVYFGISSSLNGEIRNGTIDFSMISHTSMLVVLFGKALAMMVFGIPVGIFSAALMLIVAREAPQIASYPLVFISVFFIFINMAVTGLFMAPITALARGRNAGMFAPIMSLIIALSGYLYPVTGLPQGLQIVSRILPTTWGMDSVLQAVKGPDSFWAVASGWVYGLLISAGLMTFTYFMFKQVEKRLRITGLSSY
jgi:ABC-2 type transport system permease protein